MAWYKFEDPKVSAFTRDASRKPETNRDQLTVVPEGFHVRHVPARVAAGAYRSRGGLAGAPTGGNGLGLVPAAFRPRT